MELLLLIPFLALVLIANVARTSVIAYRLTVVVVGLISALFILVAMRCAFFAVMGAALDSAGPGLSGTALGTIGVALFVTGIVSLLLLMARVRQALYTTLRLEMATEEPVHTTAVVMAVWLLGGTLASSVANQQMPVATLAQQSIQIADLWGQGVIFVMLSLLGVGLGVRRSGRETLARLGLGAVTLPQVGLALVAIFVFLLWALLVAALWFVLNPEQFNRINEISELLFADALTPLGALTIGLSAGIGEEILFRGAIQPRLGIMLTTLLFTLSHTQYELSPSLLIVFGLGLGLALIRNRYNTTLAVLIHAGYNTVAALLSVFASGGQA